MIKRLRGFDMNRTISGGLSGIARKFMEEKLAKGVQWDCRCRIPNRDCLCQKWNGSVRTDHLMHLVDFMPPANWSSHRADPLMQMFERLPSLLERAGRRQAQVELVLPESKTAP